MQTIQNTKKQRNLLRVRPTLSVDMDAVMEVEMSAWPGSLQAPTAKFMNRLNLFPQGFKCAVQGEKIVGFTTSMITEYDPSTPKTWDGITAYGTCENHDPNGDVLYVVSVAVHQEFQGLGIGSKLVQSQIAFAREQKLSKLILGARIPGYHLHQHLDAATYILQKDANGEPLDPELRFYTRQGLSITTLVPEFEEDPDSLNYGVVMTIQL